MIIALLALVLSLSTLAAAQPPCQPEVTGRTTISLAWDRPPPQAGLTLTTYVLERRIDDGPWVALQAPPPHATTTDDGPLAPGYTYAYQIRAQWTDSLGNTVLSGPGDPGTPAPCVTIADAGPPAPRHFRLQGTQCLPTYVDLSWEEGAPVQIERRDKKGWQVQTTTATSPWRDTAVRCGSTYTYRARWDTGTVWTEPVRGKVPKR